MCGDWCDEDGKSICESLDARGSRLLRKDGSGEGIGQEDEIVLSDSHHSRIGG